MRSTLTRHVFRQLLHERPIRHALCVRRSRNHHGSIACHRVNVGRVQRRTLFWSSAVPNRAAPPHDVIPGLGRLREIQERLSQGLRPPAVEEVRAALRAFLDHKGSRSLKVLDTEVETALAVAQHVHSVRPEAGMFELKEREQQQFDSLMRALLPAAGARNREAYVQLAGLLYEDSLAQRRRKLEHTPEKHGELLSLAHRPYFSVLAQCGEGALMRKILEEQVEKGRHLFHSSQFWGLAVLGYAMGRDDEGIQDTISAMQRLQIKVFPWTQQQIMTTYAGQLNMEGIKKWYEMPLENEQAPTTTSHIAILEACIATRDLAFGKYISDRIVLEELEKPQWDVVLRWSAAIGKGVDEIERLMGVMIVVGQKNEVDLRPDIDTINAIVKDANLRGDAYTAERLMNLAERRGMLPNAKTRMLQIEYRLSVKDFEGARLAYQALQAHEVLENEDVPLINRLILKSCQREEPDEDEIMSYVSDLLDRKGAFEAEALAALSVFYLQRQQFHDVIDLLQANASRYQAEQRAYVRNVLVAFVCGPENTTEDAWDTYCILKETFDAELDKPTRVTIMDTFFARSSHEMAVHVFGHMRQANTRERRPDAATYAACFRGVARSQDAPALETVHNMLKLDAEVEAPTTALRAALMRAHFECGSPRRALAVWDEVVFSREGPSYESIVTALEACQFAPRGGEYARALWGRLRRFRVEVTKEIADAYVAALAAQNLVGDATAVVQSMRQDLGAPPDAIT